MHTRYKRELEYLPPKSFHDPKEAVQYFLIYIRKVLRQYLEAQKSPNRLFVNNSINGMDAMLCKKIISEYKHEKRNKSSIVSLINCLKRSIELLDSDGEVSRMLSILFSYFPDYLPIELATKIKLDFSWAEGLCEWAESYKKAKESEIVEFIPAPTQFDFKIETKEYEFKDDLTAESKLSVDAAFKKLEEQDKNDGYETDDLNDAENAVSSITHAIKIEPVETSKAILNRVKMSLAKQNEETNYNRYSFYILCIIAVTLNEKAAPVETIPQLVRQSINRVIELQTFCKKDSFFNDKIAEIISWMHDYISPHEAKRIVDFFSSTQDFNSTQLVELYTQLIHKVDVERFKKITDHILNSSMLDKSYELLKKIAFIEFDNEIEIRQHWQIRRCIVDALVKKLRHEANDYYHSNSFSRDTKPIELVNNALCSIIPTLSLQERAVLTRKIKASELEYLSSDVLCKLKDMHECEKTISETCKFNPDLAKIIVKAGR